MFKKEFCKKWIKKNDMDFVTYFDEMSDEYHLSERNYDSEEAELNNSRMSEKLAECIEQYLKAIILLTSSVSIPDNIKSALGDDFKLSEEEEIAFFTQKEDFNCSKYPTLKRIQSLPGNGYKVLKSENASICNLFSGRLGHNIGTIFRSLPQDVQDKLIKLLIDKDATYFLKKLFSHSDDAKAKEIYEELYTLHHARKDDEIFKKKPELADVRNYSAHVKSLINALYNEYAKGNQAFFIDVLDEISNPTVSNAFVDGRYYSDDLRSNFRVLFDLCEASNAIVSDFFPNAICIHHKHIFPDSNSQNVLLFNGSHEKQDRRYYTVKEAWDGYCNSYGFKKLDQGIYYKIVDNDELKRLYDAHILWCKDHDFFIIYTENGQKRILHQQQNIGKGLFEVINRGSTLNFFLEDGLQEQEHDDR